MICQILANTLVVSRDSNAMHGENFRVADAGKFKNLWRLNSPGRQNDLVASPRTECSCITILCVGIFRAGGFALSLKAHSHCHWMVTVAAAFDRCDMRPGQDPQIGPPARRIQIGFLGRKPHAVFLSHLIIAEPVLTGPVIVNIAGITATGGRLHHLVEPGIAIAQGGNIQRSASRMVGIIICREFGILGLAEILQHIGISPPRIAALCPFIIIG